MAHDVPVDIDDWWWNLDPQTQQWLIDHNGEPLSSAVVEEIEAAGGEFDAEASWVGATDDPDGLMLSDDAIDWIESVANDESDQDESDDDDSDDD
jgi:hypothetical protein